MIEKIAKKTDKKNCSFFHERIKHLIGPRKPSFLRNARVFREELRAELSSILTRANVWRILLHHLHNFCIQPVLPETRL